MEPCEKRYDLPAKRKYPFDVPDDIQPKRRCIQNEDTKAKRYEIKWGEVSEHPCLSITADEGPRDKPAWLYLAAILRVLEQMDPLHRWPRDAYLAAVECNCWQMILDTTAVFNYDHAPYLSEENFRRAKEAVKRYVIEAGPDDELLVEEFEALCESLGDVPLDYGSKEHKERVVASLPYAAAFKAMVEKVRWTRWGSHAAAAEEFLPILPCKRFAVKVATYLGEARLPADLRPVAGGDGAPHPAVVCGGPSSSGPSAASSSASSSAAVAVAVAPAASASSSSSAPDVVLPEAAAATTRASAALGGGKKPRSSASRAVQPRYCASCTVRRLGCGVVSGMHSPVCSGPRLLQNTKASIRARRRRGSMRIRMQRVHTFRRSVLRSGGWPAWQPWRKRALSLCSRAARCDHKRAIATAFSTRTSRASRPWDSTSSSRRCGGEA